MLRSLSRFCLLASALATSAAQAAAPKNCLAGSYEGNAVEIGAGLELSADGRFRYGLAYGALDEQAEGKWEGYEGGVILIGDPVTAPRFSLVSEGTAPAGAYRIMLDLPKGMDRQYFDVLLTLAESEPIEQQFAEDGLVVELKPGDRVVSAQLQLGIYDLVSEPIPLSGANGREARFRFEPNDIGKVAFERTALPKEGRNLLLERHGRLLRFRPVKGGCKS